MILPSGDSIMIKTFSVIAGILVLNLVHAQDSSLCDQSSKIDRVQITEKVDGIICKDGEDVLVIPEKEVKTEHLVYAGFSMGMPWILGGDVTYANRVNGRANYHITGALLGSLGANGVKLEYGKHPFKNSFFVGATGTYYQGLIGQYGLMAGPTIGFAGTRSGITGQIGLSLLGGHDTRAGGFTTMPEVTMGLRIRLFKK
jgi:hypothetical protein